LTADRTAGSATVCKEVDKTKLSCDTSHRRSTTVSLETYSLFKKISFVFLKATNSRISFKISGQRVVSLENIINKPKRLLSYSLRTLPQANQKKSTALIECRTLSLPSERTIIQLKAGIIFRRHYLEK